MLTTTRRRVSSNTSRAVNAEIARCTEERIARCAAAGPTAIDRRLAELDREWDIERCVETMAPLFTLAGLVIGIAGKRRWFSLPLVVQGFFLQHALQGWCPPVPILRRLGIRTMDEINEERMALKALRGDFRGTTKIGKAKSKQSVRRAVLAARS